MKHSITQFFASGALLCALSLHPSAADPVPDTLHFQTRLVDFLGLPVQQTGLSVEFRLYDVPLGGSALYTESRSLDVVDGYLSTAIGELQPLPETLFDSQLFLGVTFGVDSEMTPRFGISSVPFAARAARADDVSGDIDPSSVAVNGIPVIDPAGNWVGSPSGLQGPIGPQGPTGPAGPGGSSGADGVDGTDGADGAPGPTGAQGVQGIQGPPGPTGPAGDTHWGLNGSDTYYLAGEVGVGTSAPLSDVHVRNVALPVPSNAVGLDDVVVESGDASVGLYSNNNGGWGSGLSFKEIAGGALVDSWSIVRQTTSGGAGLAFTHGAQATAASNSPRMTLTPAGHVGINTTTPAERLHVSGGTGPVSVLIEADTDNFDESDQPSLVMTQDGGLIQGQAGFFNQTNEFELRRIDEVGAVSSYLRLTATSAAVDVLEVEGGSDLVERFTTGDQTLAPGTVVVIDTERAGELTTTDVPYDRRVAGVVSGAGGVNPGLTLSQRGVLDGDTLVAMAGRVYVRCSTENGSIVPGDLLTTASLDGHAMRAEACDRANGAVIGKAMSHLDAEDGQAGLVLVLVNLQ